MGEVAARPWGFPRRLAFRFVFVYLVLFCPVPIVPWATLVPWVGKHILGFDDLAPHQTGSGDTLFNYVRVFSIVVLAAASTLAWSVLDRRRPDYYWFHEGLRVYVRYWLAVIMFGYGMAKVTKTQFPFPDLEWLVEAYGESSPMRLLWVFMGYSTSYTVFTGLVEAIGAVLLFSRRTTTLGALVLTAALVNVVLLNLSYDVPVKLYSVHYLLMALFLLLPDAQRLANVLVLNRPAEAAELRTPLSSARMERARRLLKVAVVALIVGPITAESIRRMRQHGDSAPKPPLYGIYDVERFVRNGRTLPPLLTDTTRWRRMIVNRYGGLSIQFMDGTVQRFGLKHEADEHRISLHSMSAPGKNVLTYEKHDQDRMRLDGSLDSEPVVIELRRTDESSFLLVNREFSWITEYPYNR